MVSTADIEERNSAIADIFVEEFDAPLQVLTANEDENGVVFGNLISSGEFYTYAFDDESLGIVHHEAETEELNEYARGLLGGYGIHTDSELPYEYTFGFIRTDAQVRCTKGGTPCGKVCLPKGAVCRKYGGGGTTGGKLKSSGGGSLAGGIAGGVAAAAAVGTAGGLAYLNRKNLATGGKAVGERLKKAGTEGYGELKTGLSAAKTSLREGYKTAGELDKKLKEAETNATGKDKSAARLLRRSTASGAKGMATGGASGAAIAGVENATRAVGRNLSAAGKDIKMTAKNSYNTTSRAAKDVREKFFNLANPVTPNSSAIVKREPDKTAIIKPETTTTALTKSPQTTTKKKRGRPPKNS